MAIGKRSPNDRAVFALGIGISPLEATTRTAASCSQLAVEAAVNSAASGDTVLIPAGTCPWTSGVSWTAPPDVTLKGAGTSVTGGGDQTVITDNINSGSPLMRVTVPSTGLFRMTGITVQSGSGAIKDGGTIALSGPGSVRLDHLHLNPTSDANYVILRVDEITGVLDHSILDLQSTNAIFPFNSGSTGTGDDVWAQDTGFGGNGFFFVEDNLINGSPDSHDTRVADVFWGGKIVIRFNTIIAACGYEVHATGSWGNGRGGRAVELYGNLFQQASGQAEPNRVMADFSSGPALAWGNNADRVFKTTYRTHVTRANNETYGQTAVPNGWGYAGTEFTGTGSTWDGNTVASNGYPALDQPGRGKGDQLSGDHPNKINVALGGHTWPRNALEPIYMWNNHQAGSSWEGGTVFSNDSGGRMTSDVDYYLQASGIQTSPTSPFNGTSGTGWGTLANRPRTCTAGVGYWVTDQGSWNTSQSNPYGVQQNGADGVLYKCTAPNNWTLYYTPYTYPHPLIGGTPPIPNYHPADTTPQDSSIDITELTNFGSCWKTGCTWAGVPPLEFMAYVTRAGAIWKGGEAYHYDSGQNPPDCWVVGR